MNILNQIYVYIIPIPGSITHQHPHSSAVSWRYPGWFQITTVNVKLNFPLSTYTTPYTYNGFVRYGVLDCFMLSPAESIECRGHLWPETGETDQYVQTIRYLMKVSHNIDFSRWWVIVDHFSANLTTSQWPDLAGKLWERNPNVVHLSAFRDTPYVQPAPNYPWNVLVTFGTIAGSPMEKLSLPRNGFSWRRPCLSTAFFSTMDLRRYRRKLINGT